jgi:hypothetical protein
MALPLQRKRSDIFRVLGQFIAKALLDSRIIDVSFNKIFLKLILGETVPQTVESINVSLACSIDVGNELIVFEPTGDRSGAGQFSG